MLHGIYFSIALADDVDTQQNLAYSSRTDLVRFQQAVSCNVSTMTSKQEAESKYETIPPLTIDPQSIYEKPNVPADLKCKERPALGLANSNELVIPMSRD